MASLTSPVFASFRYLQESHKWATIKPYFLNIPDLDLKDEDARSNGITKIVDNILVKDMRLEDNLDLDTNGFIYAEQKIPGLKEMFEQEDAGGLCTAEVASFLRDHLEAKQVILFRVGLRRRDECFPRRPWGESGYAQPLMVAHSDFTPRTAAQIIQNIEQNTAYYPQGIGNRRVQMLQVWRPLERPLRDSPLALLDTRTIDFDRDLIASDFVSRESITEGFHIFHSARYQWYYLSDQLPKDILIFKGFDSDQQATLCERDDYFLRRYKCISNYPTPANPKW